jgi:hypothetical protein
VTVTPSGGYTGTVDLSLSTSSTYLQDYACYDISNAKVSGTSAVNETLTLYTGTANCSSASVQRGRVHAFHRAIVAKISFNPMLPISVPASIGLILAGVVGWRFRRIRVLSCMLALAALGLALSGCSTSSSSSSKKFSLSVSPSSVTVSAGTSGIPTGSYTLTIDGEDNSNSSLTATTTMTLVMD